MLITLRNLKNYNIYKNMICETCEINIPESNWKTQCLKCFKSQYKNCLLCLKKKKNKYLFCYDCNINKKQECIITLKEKAQNDLYNQQFVPYDPYDTKSCKECGKNISKVLKWKKYCSDCFLFHHM